MVHDKVANWVLDEGPDGGLVAAAKLNSQDIDLALVKGDLLGIGYGRRKNWWATQVGRIE